MSHAKHAKPYMMSPTFSPPENTLLKTSEKDQDKHEDVFVCGRGEGKKYIPRVLFACSKHRCA